MPKLDFQSRLTEYSLWVVHAREFLALGRPDVNSLLTWAEEQAEPITLQAENASGQACIGTTPSQISAAVYGGLSNIISYALQQ